jgi:hypothetical protein
MEHGKRMIGMRCNVVPLGWTLLALLPGAARAQDVAGLKLDRIASLPREVLDSITARGKLLAEYDFASWYATDAVLAAQPRSGLIEGYLARQKPDGLWEVVFGKLSVRRDTFYVAFRALQREAGSQLYTTYEMRPPAAEQGYFLLAARALYVTRDDFGPKTRPYTATVAQIAGNGEWYVYYIPGPRDNRVWLSGGDIRYRVSADGRTITEKRPLHNATNEFLAPPTKVDSSTLDASLATIVRDDRPEDTDVFQVLVRQPRVRGLFVSRSYYFVIDTTGRIMAYDRDTTKR